MKTLLMHFLGDAISWLIGTATTKDVTNIKTRIKQLITTQHNQKKTLVHIISILNTTRYATQVNRQHINIVMSVAEKDTSGCQNTLQHHAFPIQQLELSEDCTPHLLHPGKPPRFSVLKSPYTPWIMLTQQQQAYSHHMYCLYQISKKCYFTLRKHFPSTMHLLISSEDALHFYRYPCNHILIADEQFLLLIDVPIQDCVQQFVIYEVFNLAIHFRHFSIYYSIKNRYLGIMHNKTKAVEISEDQFRTC